MQLYSLLRHITGRLTKAAVDSPRLSAELLVAHALGVERQDLLKELLLRPEQKLAIEALAAIDRLTERRAAGEPAAYILGVKEFYGREFRVSPDVLIPRPETELLIDAALELCGKKDTTSNTARFADFGTGSGCIAITLALELPGWQGAALDKSPATLRVARENAHRLGANALHFTLADFARPPLPESSLDILASNPPYISEHEYTKLSREVRSFEPKSALVPSLDGLPSRPAVDSGLNTASGLEDIATIISQAERLLKNGGVLLVEIGCSQEKAVHGLFTAPCWFSVEVRPDLAGLPRLLVAKKH